MGRPKKNILERLTLDQMRFVLNRAVVEGKLVVKDIIRMAAIQDELESLKARMDALIGGSGGNGRRRGRPPTQATGTGSGKPKQKRHISPERRAAMRLQGRFLATSRKMKAKDRAAFSKAYKSAQSPSEKEKIIKEARLSF